MSDDLKKSLETALNRIAQLETEVSRSRAERAVAKPAAFDQAAFARQFTQDPIGVMSKMGVPLDHTTRVLVAHALGDNAPPELKVLAAMGPQVSATTALSSDVAAMRQRLDAYEAKDKASAVRSSFQALAVDKQKYPHLSKAIAADPDLFAEDLGRHGGSAEDLAATLEARIARVAKIVAPTASTNADTQQAQSTESKQAPTSGGIDPTPPPITTPKPGVWNESEHARIRDEVVRKFSKPAIQ